MKETPGIISELSDTARTYCHLSTNEKLSVSWQFFETCGVISYGSSWRKDVKGSLLKSWGESDNWFDRITFNPDSYDLKYTLFKARRAEQNNYGLKDTLCKAHRAEQNNYDLKDTLFKA